MKFWCKLGLHSFVAAESGETSIISSHENAKSIQEILTYSWWSYKCAFCDATVKQDLNIRRTWQNILYVNGPLDKLKGELKNEQISKVVPQEVKVKPTPYKEPKL